MALLALGAGLLLGATARSGAERTADSFLAAWEREDFRGMYELLTPAARRRTTLGAFRRAYRDAQATATATRLETGDPKQDGDIVLVPMQVSTRVFGRLKADLALPIEDERIAWAPHLAFPGVARGQRLSRVTRAPERAPILTRDGQAIVEGPGGARRHPLGEVSTSIAGRVGPPATEQERRDLHARGFPSGALVGLDGLERVLEAQTAGTPGGVLLAGGHRLASTEPREAEPVRTTLDLDIQRAAITALAGRFGGIAAIDPQNGEVRALAGIAFSAPQPPGSTFKIVTAVAALERKLVTPSTSFPVETHAVIDGVELENAHGESCGGSFANSFAKSCNSVFAPLGVRVGAKRLVAAAERFGFNRQPAIAGAAPSTIPEQFSGPLDLGSSAIGQGRVLATPLMMASLSQVIAADGVRYEPTLLSRARPRGTRVTSRRVARTMEQLMIGVVQNGTGTAARLDPVKVAGKTGTAELEKTVPDEGGLQESSPLEEDVPPGFHTDAWFTAYAPVRRPRLAVGVLFVRAGAGGETAAPAAREVLRAGLK